MCEDWSDNIIQTEFIFLRKVNSGYVWYEDCLRRVSKGIFEGYWRRGKEQSEKVMHMLTFLFERLIVKITCLVWYVVSDFPCILTILSQNYVCTAHWIFTIAFHTIPEDIESLLRSNNRFIERPHRTSPQKVAEVSETRLFREIISGVPADTPVARESQISQRLVKYYLGGGFKDFLFLPFGENYPFWLIFFRWVETTN